VTELSRLCMKVCVCYIDIEREVGEERYSRAGVGNSFGFAGHIRDKLGILRPVHVHVN